MTWIVGVSRIAVGNGSNSTRVDMPITFDSTSGGLEIALPSEERWLAMISECNSSRAYRRILIEMFYDHNYNAGRMGVLQFYTSEVCLMYPDIADVINAEYTRFLARHVNNPPMLVPYT